MRGTDEQNLPLFVTWEHSRIPAEHPLLRIKQLIDPLLKDLSPEFDQIYAREGRPSIAPEKLVRALVLQVLYSIRSERLLIEFLQYHVLFRTFVGLSMEDQVWVPSVFSKNRDRLLKGDIIQKLFQSVFDYASQHHLVSSEHFSVDGTMLKAWASMKSLRPRAHGTDGDDSSSPSGGGTPPPGKSAGRNVDANWHGQKRSNDTHVSTTDPDARLMKKGNQGAMLGFQGNLLMENRHGLVVAAEARIAGGKAERDGALDMIDNLGGTNRITLGADKGYDAESFIESLRERNVTPHLAMNQHSILDGRTTRHPGYARSLCVRKRIEECFGWEKTIGNLRQLHHRGVERVGQVFVLTAAVYNLVRISNITRQVGFAEG